MPANQLQARNPLPNIPWAEYIGKDTGYTQSYQWKADSSQATWTIMVPWENYIDTSGNGLIPQVLGYSERIAPGVIGGPGQISRQIPIKHPYFPWLYATMIADVKGIKPTGIYNNEAQGGSFSMQYEFAIVTIGFSSLTYDVISDQELADNYSNDESYRYVTKISESTAEYISVDRGQYVFTGGAVGNPDGKTFNLGTGRITIKVDLQWDWHDVPARSIFNNDGTGNIATNIYNCIGKVNNAEIWGFPAGTLLMMTPKFTPTIQPVSPLTMGVANPLISPPRSFDVRLLFKYWDPPVAPGGNGGYRGHNLAMYVRDNYFYKIVTQQVGGVGVPGLPLFTGADFSTIFKSL